MSTRSSREVGGGDSSTGKGNRTLIFFVCSFLAVVGLVVGLVLGLRNRENENQARKSSSEGIQEYVVARGLSPSSAFASSTSPQSKAVEWMAQEDPQNFATPDASMDMNTNDQTYQFTLRYVMTVVYYSTGGDTDW